MEFKRLRGMSGILILLFMSHLSISQTVITSNQTGKKDNCWYEYWKDNGNGTMTLKDGCNFSCEWSSVNNILFRRGVRPGSRDIIVSYSADYKPTGNSYLSVYGWLTDSLVEYYIIESWGSWKPQFGQSKGTVESDSGIYDIYQNQRTGPSIQGNTTFKQYYSVRRTKRTSGIITCANHFKAWESKGMSIGKFYEVAFNVEAYQSGGGSADVTVSFGTTEAQNNYKNFIQLPKAKGSIIGQVTITNGIVPKIVFSTPVKTTITINIFNLVGQRVATSGKKEYNAGTHSVTIDASRLRKGVYYYTLNSND